jgi:diaminopimelate decarboxylase
MNRIDTNKINHIHTPFFYYDVDLLKKTIELVKAESEKYGFIIHYALKANSNSKILRLMSDYGLGADCVSGNEVQIAVDSRFKKEHIVYAGVGKSDREINIALDNDIFCFNCESIPELEVINELAKEKNKIAKVALRINPNVNANTHHYITTGIEENKFGINMWEMNDLIEILKELKSLKLIGLHFHIGSQIRDFMSFKDLCLRINEIQNWFHNQNIFLKEINVGGGLGINYEKPWEESIPDFKKYFKIFNDFLEIFPGQKVHFELGRSIVGQCGSLLTKVLYVKKGVKVDFAIVDGGMTELIRPALYQAYHHIQNLTSELQKKRYDVVGPICESADYFGKSVYLPETNRGDYIEIQSCGAYGEVMASSYNSRDIAKAYYSDEIIDD